MNKTTEDSAIAFWISEYVSLFDDDVFIDYLFRLDVSIEGTLLDLELVKDTSILWF